jgi:hypothetical protein
MHHHPGRFVDRDYGLVLVKNPKRERLWVGLKRRRKRGANFDALAASQSRRSFGGERVDQDVPAFYPILNAGAAIVGELRGEVMVESLAGGVGGGHKREDFTQANIVRRESRVLPKARQVKPSCSQTVCVVLLRELLGELRFFSSDSQLRTCQVQEDRGSEP